METIVFHSNKPWVTPDLTALLQDKKRAMQFGNRDDLRRVQRDEEDQRLQPSSRTTGGQRQEENGEGNT